MSEIPVNLDDADAGVVREVVSRLDSRIADLSAVLERIKQLEAQVRKARKVVDFLETLRDPPPLPRHEPMCEDCGHVKAARDLWDGVCKAHEVLDEVLECPGKGDAK